MNSNYSWVFALFLFCICGCSTVVEAPPKLPDSFWGFNLNGGRTQAITVSPLDKDKIVIATQFGGLWKTTNGGERWRHINLLNEVFVNDVQYGADGETLIATVGRNNKEIHNGGIWVSRDNGNTWSRPPTSILPSSPRIPDRPVAKGIALDPDNSDRWYVGTDYGIAISTDNGRTWNHVEIDSSVSVGARKLQQSVQSVLPFPGGSILAMTRNGIFRSDNFGAAGSWTKIRNEGFHFYETMGWNKMDRSPYWPYAFIMKDYSTLYFYELGSDSWTRIPLPDGAGSRGPFVRVGKPSFGARYITIWIGQGNRALKVTRRRVGAIKSITESDWTIFGRGEGIHDDMGDLGLDVNYRPVMIGSDGGVFKPDPENRSRWINAAPVGSLMNSYLITDLLGVNVDDEGARSTALHYSTQDNAVWGSLDDGNSWPNVDCCEGFHIEGPHSTTTPDDVTIAYGRVGAGYSHSRMSDLGLANQRNVSDLDVDGTSYQVLNDDGNPVNSEAGQAFYLKKGYWIRSRRPEGANRQVIVSTDNGATWRRRFDLTVNTAGIFHRTKAHYPISYVKAYLPVFTGSNNSNGSPRIGLVRLNQLIANRVDTIGAASIINLPNNGSLGRRATEFDWQAVVGVHPRQWRWVIAPDIVNGVVKVTRNGGITWETDHALTRLVTKGGDLRLWDNHEYLMQVTHIAFDPYREERVLVGTREAGILCSTDGGETWGKIPKSDKVLYATGFHFKPGGSVMASTYGRGLWKIRSDEDSCVNGMPSGSISSGYTINPDLIDVHFPRDINAMELPGIEGELPQVPFDEDDLQAIPADDPNRFRLIADTGYYSSSDSILGDKGKIYLTAFGLKKDTSIKISSPSFEIKSQKAPLVKENKTVFEIIIPEDLSYGEHIIYVSQNENISSVRFRKIHSDKHLGKKENSNKGAKVLSFDELEILEAKFPEKEVPFKELKQLRN